MPTYPEHYWHCQVRVRGAKSREYAVVNDLDFSELKRQIIDPWHQGVAFPVAGMVISKRDDVEKIKITHTVEPTKIYAERHYAMTSSHGIGDWTTDSRLLPLSNGVDHTHELLFAALPSRAPEPDVAPVLQLCERLPRAAQILAHRNRGKAPYRIDDEYDIQDLLHAVLRAYLKYTVHEEPLGKIGGAKSGRADVAIEDLGMIVEVKFARGPRDQQRFVEE